MGAADWLEKYIRGIISTAAHVSLGTLSMVPVIGGVADVVDTALYAYEGDHVGSALSASSVAASLVPGPDQVVGLAKIGHVLGVGKAYDSIYATFSCSQTPEIIITHGEFTYS